MIAILTKLDEDETSRVRLSKFNEGGGTEGMIKRGQTRVKYKERNDQTRSSSKGFGVMRPRSKKGWRRRSKEEQEETWVRQVEK